jgi:prepilin-type N-terminal cleavage/methylation domain-containing protein
VKRSRTNEGFTLVELMVVVLIIGILVAIAVPIFNSSKGSALSKTCFANQRELEGSVQTYQAAHGSLPTPGTVDASHVLISGGYLKKAPQCPLGLQPYAIDASGTITSASLTCGHPHY